MKQGRITFIFGILFLLLVGCQHQPTKVMSEEKVKSEGAYAKNILQGQPVLLDARPAFEFNLIHVPGAINVRWEDFTQGSSRARGLLDKDSFALARRLALIGIDPSTKVIVLGKGVQGAGEEGRVAWTLKYLGVSEVYTLLHSSVREMNPNGEVPPVKNKSYWKPLIREGLSVDLQEFKAQTQKENSEFVILDVRSSAAFAASHFSQNKLIKSKVINLPWQNFFDDKGAPSTKGVAELAKHGVTFVTPLFVVSQEGVESGAVTYALDALGFKRVSNFAGGYQIWR